MKKKRLFDLVAFTAVMVFISISKANEQQDNTQPIERSSGIYFFADKISAGAPLSPDSYDMPNF